MPNGDEINENEHPTLVIPTDAALKLHTALGLTDTQTPETADPTVSVTLDDETADAVKGALKTGMVSASALAFTEEGE